MRLMYKRKNLNTIIKFSGRLFFTLCLALFLSHDIIYAENNSQIEIEETTDSSKKEQSSIENNKNSVMKRSQTKQKRNFIPSEKITADSSVPFPVDI